jgi:predicted dehydrogenase
MTEAPDLDAYSLKSRAAAEVAAPDLPYRPSMPKDLSPGIALVGAGGISAAHLKAYRLAGFNVAVVCSRTRANAERRRDEYYPDADATDDVEGTLRRDDIAVVDLTPHPAERLALMETALLAGKHVLSQKPFVLDLDEGARLADLAADKGLVLAVNQNGRWAPHLAWMREAVRAGLIGSIQSFNSSIHWDHSWIGGTAFEALDELILYDFAIHRFDFLTSLVGSRATSVFATVTSAAGQSVRPPMLAQALVEFDGGHAALLFDGAAPFGAEDRTVITGSRGTLASVGPELDSQTVVLTNEVGRASPALHGTWFHEGFVGTMSAVLKAAEDGTPPLNDARRNLDALALVFAAVASANRGERVTPGTVRSLAAARGR